MRTPERCVGWLSLLCALSCAPQTLGSPNAKRRSRKVVALLPSADGPFAFSHARIAEARSRAQTRSPLAEVDTCAGCHPRAAEEWQASAHAHSSFDNPWYRAVVDQFRQDRGHKASQFCAGCHDPELLFQGAMMRAIDPADPVAYAGVTCRICHSVRSVSTDGNASYTVSLKDFALPRPGDAASLAQHRLDVAPPELGTAELCGTCHRSFLDPALSPARKHVLSGMDDLGPWQSSPFGGGVGFRFDPNLEPRSCQECHMRADTNTGQTVSHRFAGAQRTLARALGDRKQERAVIAMLQSAAGIDLGPWPVLTAHELMLDVVVWNEGTGHHVPGGTRDIQDTWIEVIVRNHAGAVLGEAGTRHGRGEADDPTAFRLDAVMLDREAKPEYRHLVHRFWAPSHDRTIAPRDARVVRYRLPLDGSRHDPSSPLEVEVRLLHRRHNRPLARFACALTHTPRGRAFDRGALRIDRPTIDPCAEAPITELSKSTVWIGKGAHKRRNSGPATDPMWRRALRYARGLSHAPQEQMSRAETAAKSALLLTQKNSPTAGAEAASVLARIRIEQGRYREAIRLVGRAARAVGPHPALSRIRADAETRRWRFRSASTLYQRLVSDAPRDPSVLAEAAKSWGSLDRNALALQAAQTGLGLAPRNLDLLRTQALALKGLQTDDSSVRSSLAFDAAFAHDTHASEVAVRARCKQQRGRCQLGQTPIPVIVLRKTP